MTGLAVRDVVGGSVKDSSSLDHEIEAAFAQIDTLKAGSADTRADDATCVARILREKDKRLANNVKVFSICAGNKAGDGVTIPFCMVSVTLQTPVL